MMNDEWRRDFNDAVVTCLKVQWRISHGDLEENRENLWIAVDLIVNGTEHIPNRNVEYYQLCSDSLALCRCALPSYVAC
jgi:hypothetical protein